MSDRLDHSIAPRVAQKLEDIRLTQVARSLALNLTQHEYKVRSGPPVATATKIPQKHPSRHTLQVAPKITSLPNMHPSTVLSIAILLIPNLVNAHDGHPHQLVERATTNGPCTGAAGAPGVCISTADCTADGGTHIQYACPGKTLLQPLEASHRGLLREKMLT